MYEVPCPLAMPHTCPAPDLPLLTLFHTSPHPPVQHVVQAAVQAGRTVLHSAACSFPPLPNTAHTSSHLTTPTCPAGGAEAVQAGCEELHLMSLFPCPTIPHTPSHLPAGCEALLSP